MYVYKTGRGIINSAINKLPFELHFPGYQFCGPGTKLKERLERGDRGINLLDSACKEHDIAYAEHKSGKERTIADKRLASLAWKRVKSNDTDIRERTAALAVAAAMRAKIGLSKLGAGMNKNGRIREPKNNNNKNKKKKICCMSKLGSGMNKNGRKRKSKNKKKIPNTKNKKKKCCTFKGLVKHAKTAITNGRQGRSSSEILANALGAAKRVAKGRKGEISMPRIIPIPKTGGLLPLVPIFAGLSALGTLAGGTTAIVRAIGAAKEAKEELKESQRHNNVMESIAIGRTRQGEGLYMRPYKTGYGLYLQPYPQSKN